MALANTEMSERNGRHGWDSLNTTVLLPCAFMLAMAKSRNDSGPAELVRDRFIEKTTSSATRGLPSENLTPGRSVKCERLVVRTDGVTGSQPGHKLAGGARYEQWLEDLVERVDVAGNDGVGRVESGRANTPGKAQRRALLGAPALARARPVARSAPRGLADAGSVTSEPSSVTAEPAMPYFNRSRLVSGFFPGYLHFFVLPQ